ncbi:TetR family transcriptional regulator [Conexibacter stalactiti]|uniref:TetR family transcriptional regulator n=1 Tax=Conexibacter stalactiti TaxID=1940611 RepID=A0ABU4HNZ9_9ACTN|nr:TetR family transcriptional regulator [Conexibacter stalactiti]MDW5593779.1 TetR family transcriptional regulator [Conexibacter stalactiti]MEC5034421.1 TetR family transcriptional regulator [Conexibacter stalactiti]
MAPPPDTSERPLGLRERKKARTRAAIQLHALRLFKAQGYTATTVDEIAEAAEVSPSTFFRYFPTKEDVVLHDSLDPLLLAAFRGQPAELTPLQALRAALAQMRAELPPEEWAREEARHELVVAVPELRARLIDGMLAMTHLLADVVAERVGRAPGDFEVRVFTGALVGVAMTTMLEADEHAIDGYFARFEEALKLLEAGLPL